MSCHSWQQPDPLSRVDCIGLCQEDTLRSVWVLCAMRFLNVSLLLRLLFCRHKSELVGWFPSRLNFQPHHLLEKIRSSGVSRKKCLLKTMFHCWQKQCFIVDRLQTSRAVVFNHFTHPDKWLFGFPALVFVYLKKSHFSGQILQNWCRPY